MNIKKIFDKYESQMILFLGIIITLVSLLINREEPIRPFQIKGSDLQTILISIGCSLIASSLMYKLSLRRNISEDEYLERMTKWGLENIYTKRAEMNKSCDDELKKTKELDFISFGLSGFRQSVSSEVEEIVKKGAKIRILTLHPESEFVKARERDEKKVIGSIRKEIYELYEWINTLKEIAPDSNNVQIKFYDTCPLYSYQKVGTKIYTGPFIYGLESQKTITYEFAESNEGYSYYNKQFNRLWNDHTLVNEVELLQNKEESC